MLANISSLLFILLEAVFHVNGSLVTTWQAEKVLNSAMGRPNSLKHLYRLCEFFLSPSITGPSF